MGTTMQVRLVQPAGGSWYFYFPGVSPERAVELAEYHAAAQCLDVSRYEVRDDIYGDPYTDPVLAVHYPGEDQRRMFAVAGTNL